MDRLILRGWLSAVLLLGLLIGAAGAAPEPQGEKFGGVGLQVVPTINGHLVVLHVLPQSPAATGGLLPGDLVFKVDDFPLEGSEFAAVVAEHLWGPAGSRVTLHYLRPGVAGPKTVTLRRANMTPRLTVTPGTREGQESD